VKDKIQILYKLSVTKIETKKHHLMEGDAFYNKNKCLGGQGRQTY
jgi:hypothetical protein